MDDFKKWFEDAPEEFLELVLSQLQKRLADIKEQALRSIFVGNQEVKQKKTSVQDEINTLYANIQLFSKGIQAIAPGTSTGQHNIDYVKGDEALEKHLLKTLCTDLVNRILIAQATQHMIKVDKVSTPSEQSALVTKLPSQISKLLVKVIQALNGKSTEAFLKELDTAADALELFLKPLDKKSEKQLVLAHRQALLDQLVNEENPATALQLVCVILYLKKQNVVLHAPGRSVPMILTKLKELIPPATSTQLTEFQQLVVKFLTAPDDQVKAALKNKIQGLKAIVLGKDEDKQTEVSANSK